MESGFKGVRRNYGVASMSSDCLHCEINELVQKRIVDSEPVDVALLAASVIESLVDLIIQVAPESEHAKILADTMSHFGEVYLERSLRLGRTNHPGRYGSQRARQPCG